MSLINDALKRAGEIPPPPPPVPSQALQAAEDPPASRLPLYLMPVLLLFVIGLAVWFLSKGFEVARQVYQSSSPIQVEAREAAPPGVPPETAVRAQPDARSPATSPGLAIGSGSPQPPSPAPAPEPAAPAQPTFPDLKLQALFYRPQSPTAVINSKAVGIGSRINGATVLSITRDGVQVLWQGQSRELVLP